MNSSIRILVLTFAFAMSCVQARTHDTVHPPQWDVPDVLGTTVNSVGNDIFPMLTPDGLSLYFASDRPGGLAPRGTHGFEALDIYVAHRESVAEPWGKPELLDSPINTSRADHSVAFSNDGHWMYFASTRPGGCGGHDIYRSHRENHDDDTAWSTPENLGCVVNSKSDDSCPFLIVNEDGRTLLYFVSKRAGGPGSWDIYVSQEDGKTDKFGPAKLVRNVNSAAFDGHFDPDHGILWSGSKTGHGGGDLWFTRRDTDGNWLSPVNLGVPINTENNEGCFTLSGDGNRLIFTSDRPGSTGGYDLFISRRLPAKNQDMVAPAARVVNTLRSRR